MRLLPQIQGNNVFAVLQGHQCISLTTFRKSGKPVSTPVHFVVEKGKVYVGTRVKSGKVKRIRRNRQVQLAPCTMRGKVVGPTIEAVARILPIEEEVLVGRVARALTTNQGWMMRIGGFLLNLRGKQGEEVYLEITPMKAEKTEK